MRAAATSSRGLALSSPERRQADACFATNACAQTTRRSRLLRRRRTRQALSALTSALPRERAHPYPSFRASALEQTRQSRSRSFLLLSRQSGFARGGVSPPAWGELLWLIVGPGPRSDSPQPVIGPAGRSRSVTAPKRAVGADLSEMGMTTPTRLSTRSRIRLQRSIPLLTSLRSVISFQHEHDRPYRSSACLQRSR